MALMVGLAAARRRQGARHARHRAQGRLAQLRANLKRTIAANLKDESKTPGAGFSARPSSARSGRSSPIADRCRGPPAHAGVRAGGPARCRRDQARDAAVAMPPRRTRARPRDQRPAVAAASALGLLRVAGPLSLRGRRPPDPAKRVVSIFALQGASWKLVDVYYRTLAPERCIRHRRRHLRAPRRERSRPRAATTRPATQASHGATWSRGLVPVPSAPRPQLGA